MNQVILFSSVIFYCLMAIKCARVPNYDTNNYACSYQTCPRVDPTKLNVHIVAHTHDDVGWVKTVDEYFYPSKKHIYDPNVQTILDSVIQSLRKNPERKFMYVEMAYLWKWWNLQNETTQEHVKNLVNEGRLEIIGGGWSMNDEATTYYQSIIDEYTWGFRRLNDTFGECARPKIGWQIDPFGHSREQASIFARFGFDGMFIGRLDFEDKEKRLAEKTMEFIWHASPNLKENADLFTVILFNGYSPPPNFCFDRLCGSSIGKESNDSVYIQFKIKDFYDYIIKQAEHYQTNNIILTMGGDFTYSGAEHYFASLDKLIMYTNEFYNRRLNVFYSTPSCYLKSVNEARGNWTRKDDDFFPYGSDHHSFWTGYYTSRPTFKYFERLGNSFLQVVKQLAVLSNIMDTKDLENFREVMGVLQHHDAVSGTEQQHVADDYAKMLYDAIVRGENIVSNAISKLSTGKDSLATKQEFKNCLLLNISSCESTENNKNFIVTVYNPASHPVSTYVRIPVQGKAYRVEDHLGDKLPTQLIPIPITVIQIPGRTSNATRELVFQAMEIPPLGYQSFYITEHEDQHVVDEINKPEQIFSIENNLYTISVNDIGRVLIKAKKMDLQVVQSYHYYEGETKFRPSGAYVFRPKKSILHNIEFTGSWQIYKGPLVQELHLILNNYTSQIVRIYQDQDQIEFDWILGPIPTAASTTSNNWYTNWCYK